jgi:xanthine dehydrogenase accessory factor
VSERAWVWRAASQLAYEDVTAALATVCRRRGSLPMARDAKMAVDAGGRRWGTVGGGCTEADVTAQAMEAAEAGRPTIVSHTLNADLAGDLGLSCGGTVALFLEPVVHTEEMVVLYAAVADAIERRVPVTVYTALDWSDGPSKTAVVGDEEVAVGTSLAPHPSTPADSDIGPRTSEDGVFIEPIPRTPRVIIFGAGHVGIEIAKVASGAGFHVIVTDDRADFANRDRVPWADEIIVDHFGPVLDRLALDGDDYVLATTRGHNYDAEIIERAAASAARYVGMLGSRRKREVIFKALATGGIPEQALARVRVPIGEPIGADTPAEIAVSVVAELIRVRRGA